MSHINPEIAVMYCLDWDQENPSKEEWWAELIKSGCWSKPGNQENHWKQKWRNFCN